jgi:alpha-glucosidase
MPPEERDAFVAVTTTNTYTPLDTKDENGNVVKHEPIRVMPITDEVYENHRLDPFYKKMVQINGILIIGSQRVSDYALLEAAYTMDHTFHESPQWVKDMFEPLKIRLAIISVLEFTMDLPENNRGGRNSALADAVYQDGRSRGLGGLPQASCGEENLLNLQGDRYGGNGRQGSGENITIHEFAHTTASAIRRVQGNDGKFWTDLRAALAAARFPGDENTPPGRIFAWNRDNGRGGQPGNVYGGTNEQEYWAEGAQAWFNNANPRNSGGISTREEVKEKDPPLAALLAEVYGDGEWRYIKTTATNPDGSPMRPASELAHLAGIPRDKIPVFNNNNSPRVQLAAANPELVAGGRSGGRGGRGRGARGADATAGAGRGGAAEGGANAPGGATPAAETPATPGGGGQTAPGGAGGG